MKKILRMTDILNPRFGSAISSKKLVKDMEDRYRKVKGSMKHVKIYDEKKDTYLFRITMDSESNSNYTKNVGYDVVLELSTDIKDNDSTTITDYNLKVFSNSPSFIYTFTNYFKKNGWLTQYIPKKYYIAKAYRQPAKVRNPMQILGIEKTLWMAVRYVRDNRLHIKGIFNQDPHNAKSIRSMIGVVQSQNKVMDDIKLREKTKKEKNAKVSKRKQTSKKVSALTNKKLEKKTVPTLKLSDKFKKTLTDISRGKVNFKNNKLKKSLRR